jgi:type II secretion system protein H
MAGRAVKARMPILPAGTCNRGFTLLELLVVVCILSVVAALVIPSFSGMGERRLRSEAREIASILNYLQDSAVSRKETFPLKCNLDENSLWWKGPDGEKRRSFGDMTGVTTQSTGRLAQGELILFFEPLGIRENLSIHLMSDEKEITVTLHHLSGRVKISGDG